MTENKVMEFAQTTPNLGLMTPDFRKVDRSLGVFALRRLEHLALSLARESPEPLPFLILRQS